MLSDYAIAIRELSGENSIALTIYDCPFSEAFVGNLSFFSPFSLNIYTTLSLPTTAKRLPFADQQIEEIFCIPSTGGKMFFQ
jgi:hypothetical protein